MPPKPIHRFLCQMSLALALVILAACSTTSVGPGGKVMKVQHYHLVPGQARTIMDPAIAFERDHHLYGAVTRAEFNQRLGQYYTIFWRANDRTAPVKVLFEYRQANSGLQVKTQEHAVESPRRTQVSKFQVIGDEYQTGGRVTSWRVRLMRGSEELAAQQSYLWN